MSHYDIESPEEPSPLWDHVSIFLAGSIEMGKAMDWQRDTAQKIHDAWQYDEDIHFYNPRRHGKFTPDMELTQIRWEQERLQRANYIFMVLDPDTKSPISLLEFGEFIASGKMFVVCPETFYRYHNLVVTANMHGQRIYHTIDEGIEALVNARRKYIEYLMA